MPNALSIELRDRPIELPWDNVSEHFGMSAASALYSCALEREVCIARITKWQAATDARDGQRPMPR